MCTGAVSLRRQVMGAQCFLPRRTRSMIPGAPRTTVLSCVHSEIRDWERERTPVSRGSERVGRQRLVLLCVCAQACVCIDIHQQSRNWIAIQFSNKWLVYEAESCNLL